MITQYLNELKNEGKYTYEGIANLSGIPEATVKNIMSGKTTDPRFETVSKLVIAMGGNLNDVVAPHNEKSAENNAVMAMKHIYDERITDIKAHFDTQFAHLKTNYEQQLSELKSHSDSQIAGLRSDKKFLTIGICVVLAVLVAFLIADLLIAESGWIMRK